MNDLDRLLETAHLAAKTAGDLLVERFAGRRTIERKGERSNLVTDADRASEAAITRLIRERHPDHALLAEEGTRRDAAGALRWVVDPLDGTVNYAHRIPHFCVSIACEDSDGPLVGVVHDPVKRETFAAVRGRGATLSGAPIRVTDVAELADAMLATGFAYDPGVRAQNLALFPKLAQGAQGVRRMGSAALDLAYVAAGRIEGYWELGLSRWDIAAGVLLVREAGGVVSAIDGEADPLETGTLVAGGASVQRLLVEALAGAGAGDGPEPWS